ncbi:DNA repair protein-like protein [Ostreococcus tauri]|uniref:DNA repair protein-like protein n=1 Tax=Ostreococcus tauri TaxID=70448 RepID=A0A1Y5I9J8_OSTTA|nr:DNA repair protein-like protein [Ostreococcus tauri]
MTTHAAATARVQNIAKTTCRSARVSRELHQNHSDECHAFGRVRARASTVMTPTSDGRRSTRAYASSKSGTSTKTAYVCAECGEDARQWLGQCPACKTWDSMKPIKIDGGSSSGGTSGKNAGGGAGARAVARLAEETNAFGAAAPARRNGKASTKFSGSTAGGWVAEANAPRNLKDVIGGSGEKGSTKNAMPRRRLLGGSNEALGSEIERVLGGGVVPGGMTLVGGDPGVGKSTILLQLAGLLAESGGADAGPVLYASGEESVEQVGGRAERMGLDSDSIYLYSATRLENVLEAVATLKPSALVVDSIQTVFLEDATGSPGSVSQVRECATALLHAAKTTGIPVFIIGHVTKSGDIAGPRVLEHIVDVVLYLEGDADRAVRILRGHKNRYGSTDEVGVFQMSDEGMKPVASPSALFLGERILSPDVSAAPTVTVQGSRPFMLEVQALTNERADEGQQAPPIRTAVGLRFERMQLILAVLAKFVLGRRVQKHDIFINIVGGMKLEDPSTDVAVALAIASSFVEKALPADMAFFGEVGLGGELRPVMQAERRIAEAAAMGFKRVLLPESGSSPDMGKKTGIELVRCNTVAEALEATLGVRPVRSAAVSQPNGSWPSKFPKQKKSHS